MKIKVVLLAALQYLANVATGIDQALNAILFGYPDETLSARCGRSRHRYPYKVWVRIIDPIFYPFQGPNHCYNAHLKERARKGYHSPEYDEAPAG